MSPTDLWCDLSASAFSRVFKSIKLSSSPKDVVKGGRFMSAVGSVKETDTRQEGLHARSKRVRMHGARGFAWLSALHFSSFLMLSECRQGLWQ